MFSCRAYVYLLQGIYRDKMFPKLELIIYLGIISGGHGNLFMHLLGNIVFTSAHVEFNEKLFPCCKATIKQRLLNPNIQLPYLKNLSELKSDNDLLYQLLHKTGKLIVTKRMLMKINRHIYLCKFLVNCTQIEMRMNLKKKRVK